MLKGIFVDDRPDQKQYAELLEEASDGKAEVIFMAPNLGATELAEYLIASNLDFAALDFRLDETPVASFDGNVPNINRYKAGAVAQQLRERVMDDPKRDIPLVLLSQEDNITTMFSKDTTAQDLFDLVLKKEVLTEAKSSEEAAQQVCSLAEAYQAIKKEMGADKMVAHLCGLEEQAEGFVIEHQAIRAIDKLGFAHQIVARIFKLLIARPGILVSKEHLLARLGVAPDSPCIEDLLQILIQAGTTYGGILSGGWPRWWWHRVDAWARAAIGDMPGSLVGSERVSRLNKALGLSLAAAESRWTGNSDEYFWAACSCCGQPTELDHAVLVYEEKYPPFLDPLRVCWKCIQTGESNFEIDDADIELVRNIQSGQLVE